MKKLIASTIVVGTTLALLGCAATPAASNIESNSQASPRARTTTPTPAVPAPSISTAADYCSFLLDDSVIKAFIDKLGIDYQSLWTPDAVATYPKSTVLGGGSDIQADGIMCHLSNYNDTAAPHQVSVLLSVTHFDSEADAKRVQESPERRAKFNKGASANFDVFSVDDALGDRADVLYARPSESAQISAAVGDKTFSLTLQGEFAQTIGNGSTPLPTASDFPSADDIRGIATGLFAKMRVASYPEQQGGD